ncbi:hypothetical protein DFH07DRAFT_380442 [Mycena maculata]|uniref:Zn(2)-C6 fungal-type domain-containing protein n=1 Tax=Mycena maculata TaxID=230809 RepID=A0AAD7H7H4_9AGAR|nr:hypothetical protein DFH07DRAFT_380442 [Mycena maculata]
MPSAPEPGKKEKKTRRRLRLSCVECTKRRQRCDRVYPCGLCVSRGVSHLCRWENVPVARPAPARPPVVPAAGTSDASIQQLSARIATLEQTVVAERLRNRPRSDNHLDALSPRSSSRGLSISNDYSPHNSVASLQSASSGNSPYSSPEPYSQDDENERLASAATPLPDSVYHTVSSLAQQSLAHHGEYIGGGSSLSALYSISSKSAPRLPHVTSTEANVLFRSPPPNEPPSSSVLRLIQALPSSSDVTTLCGAFFKDVNWRFGIPEQWFHSTCSEMWNALRYTAPQVQINTNWLSLLFSVLALAPRNGLESTVNEMESREQFFSYAMTARRIGESAYLVRPSSSQTSAAQGSVLACLAVPLLCDHLAERGRVSESWKLVGHAILCAEAVGMHRDPSWRDWQKMSEDIMSDQEKLLRRRAWWGLFIWERMYGLALGRPTVIRSDVSDVVIPAPINADGTRNFFNVYQRLFIQLVHLAGETVEKCFSVGSPTSMVVRELDCKFEQWEAQLPPEFRSDIRSEYQSIPDDLDASDLVALSRQRHTLSTWYLLCRSKLHLSFITSQDDPMFLGVWAHPGTRKRCRSLCISFASDLIRLQCDAHTNATRCRNEQSHENVLTGSNWCFGGCFSLFEGAVTLASLLPQHSWQGRPGEPDTLIHQALMVLTQVANEEQSTGAIARMGGEALTGLVQELAGRTGVTNVLQTTPTTFHSFNSPTFTMNMAPTTPAYEWYSPDGAFGLQTEYGSQPNDGKEVPRYNMELQLPLLMSYEDSKSSYDSKVGLVNCYESAPRV